MLHINIIYYFIFMRDTIRKAERLPNRVRKPFGRISAIVWDRRGLIVTEHVDIVIGEMKPVNPSVCQRLAVIETIGADPTEGQSVTTVADRVVMRPRRVRRGDHGNSGEGGKNKKTEERLVERPHNEPFHP